MKKNKILPISMVIISLVLSLPSLIYLFKNKTVDGFNSYYTYFLNSYNGIEQGVVEGIIFIALILVFTLLYIKIIKNEKEIFKNKKNIMIYISLISIIFMAILPFLSSDIFYYMGDSWLASKYHENPYYTSVDELQKKGINDEILENTGYWSKTTSIYGPLFNSISIAIVTLSFGNVTLALLVYKIIALIFHLLNTNIIYKITKSKKYMLIYGLNPLVLIELLSNVHNDVYLLFFILLAIYFFIRKKNIWIATIFLGLSVAIKYSTVLLIPFILLYYFRKEKFWKKLFYCFLSGIGIVSIVVILYLPYFRDISIFTNMLVQDNKYSQSIMALLLVETGKSDIFKLLNNIRLPIFAIVYIANIAKMFFEKNISLKRTFTNYSILMIAFIFIVLTTFQKWYILWLIPTMFLANKNTRNFIFALTLVALIPSFVYFIIGVDAFSYGIYYSTVIFMLPILYFTSEKICKKFKVGKEVDT